MKTANRWMAAMALMAAVAPAMAQGMAEQAVTQGNVSWVSGGVGDPSVERMQAMSRDYNLKAIFALKTGNYVADVPVVVTDARGNKAIDTVSGGPWFLARLPPGTYRVSATFGGETLAQVANVPATGRRDLVFRFARDE
jgi:hypothetical protein